VGPYIRLIDFLSLNSRLESNDEEEELITCREGHERFSETYKTFITSVMKLSQLVKYDRTH